MRIEVEGPARVRRKRRKIPAGVWRKDEKSQRVSGNGIDDNIPSRDLGIFFEQRLRFFTSLFLCSLCFSVMLIFGAVPNAGEDCGNN